MAAGMAHDFNNCLSPIIGLSELILSRPKLIEDHDKVLKYVGTTHKAGLDAAPVVSRLREYYRDAAGGEEVKVVDLKQVVQVQLKTVHGLPALHVLVIDDDETVRNLISEYLTVDGHKVDLADGPGAGLRKIRAGRYDLVITDRAMPEMSGEQVALSSKRAGAWHSRPHAHRPRGFHVCSGRAPRRSGRRGQQADHDRCSPPRVGDCHRRQAPHPWRGRPRPQGAAGRGTHELPVVS